MPNDDVVQRGGLLGDSFDLTLPSLIERRATERPHSVAIRTVDGISLTSADFWTRVRSIAQGLQSLELPPGSRIAAMLDNCIEMLELYIAAPLAGHVFVPMNTAWRRKSLEHIAVDCEPAVVVTDAQRVSEMRRALDARGVPATLYLVEDADSDAPVLATPFESLRGSAGKLTPLRQMLPKDLAMLLYTSGTTGASKANMLSHRASMFMGASAATALGYTQSDVVHSCLPLFHANALLCGFTGSMLRGATFVLSPRFSASRFWAEVAEVGATHTSLLGSMIPLLLAREARPQERTHRVKVVYCSPMPDRISAFEERFGVRCGSTYGLTDGNILTLRPVDDSNIASCGFASPDWELRIVDDEGMPVAQGQVGELWARPRLPYIASLGYWRNPTATVELWHQLWVNTGDLLKQDAESRFHFVDRKKDAIRKGGENISSAEVEEAVTLHPRVSEAAAFAVPSDLAEDEVMVAVTVMADAMLEPEELFRHCMRQLPFFAVPRYIEIVKSLPRTENHRVRKSELRQVGVTEHTWDAGPVTRRRVEDELRRS